jgi:hypothetical protein
VGHAKRIPTLFSYLFSFLTASRAMFRRSLIALVLVGFVLSVTGCGGGNQIPPPKVTEKFTPNKQDNSKTSKAD